MKRISCIIFDLDGTLTQTNDLIYATFNHVAGKYVGKTFTPKEITAMFGPPEEVAIENLVGKDRIDEAMDEFYEFYKTHHSTMASAYQGIPELLGRLKLYGIMLAVFTGKAKRSALITLEQLRIKDYFELIVTGNDVVNHKPSAEGIRKVMETFKLQQDEVLMVGDAVADVKASREAGVSIAAAVWDSYGKDRVMKMDVDYLFHSVRELSLWLDNLVLGNGEKSIV